MGTSIRGGLSRNVTWRLAGFLALANLLCGIDRFNVSVAALTMNQSLRLTSGAFGLGVGAFFWAYVLSQLPAGLVLRRIGPTRAIAAMMIGWGACASAMGLISSGGWFIVIRVALGVAEAGFFPAILLLTVNWIAEDQRSRFIGLVSAAGVAATIVGPPIAAGLMRFDGVQGLAGWRWLFLLEGAPALLLGLAARYVLADRPQDAAWLSPEERSALELDSPPPIAEPAARGPWREVLRPELVLLAVMSFTIEGAAYTIAYWMPLVLKGMGLSIGEVGLAASLPGAVGCVAMTLWARSSDRTGERRIHLALAMALGGVGLIACGLLLHSPVLALTALCLAAAGVVSTTPVLWALPARILPASVLPIGVAFVGAVGNAGGFVAPPLVGFLEDWTHDFRLGLVVAGAPVLLAAGLAFAIGTSWAKPARIEEGGAAVDAPPSLVAPRVIEGVDLV